MNGSPYWLAGTAGIATLLVAWFAGRWLHLAGSDLWVMRVGVIALCLTAIVGLLLPKLRENSAKKKEAAASPGQDQKPSNRASTGDIASLVYEAEIASCSKLAELPGILLLDSSALTDSGILENSDLNPEALASISGAKISIAQNTFFAELKPQVYSDAKALRELLRTLTARKFRHLIRKAPEPSRSVVFCISVKSFSQPDKLEEAKTRAQEMRGRLREISRILGIQLPFYVLFTGLEDLAHCREYVTRLPANILADPFGVSLGSDLPAKGVWAEQQSRRNARGLKQLFEILSARRFDILIEEESHERRRGAYLFPREFRKLSHMGPLSDFLLEISRPYQLGSSPYLRGFYFTGALETDRVKPARQPVTEDLSGSFSEDLGLSRVLLGGVSERSFVSRPPPKVKEWVFLERLFSSVIIPDVNGLKNTFVSRSASVGRRFLLGGLSAIALLWVVVVSVSYLGNHGVENRALELSNALPIAMANPPQQISLDQLRRLDSLRLLTATLRRYTKEGRPWHLGLGLYTGNELYPEVRRVYFDRFEHLMLKLAQITLADKLNALSKTTGITAGFESTYSSLKAYLITRSHPDKSTREFLSPILLASWQAQMGNDPTQARVAREQFDFFSAELLTDPPYPSHPDDSAIAAGRQYLRDNFGGSDQVYSLMKASASRENAAIEFSGEDVVVGTPKISGAFTKAGWSAMQRMLHNPGQWSAEPWVVVLPQTNATTIATELPTRYTGDYIQQWTDFLTDSKVVACRARSAADTAKRLALLSDGTNSPLLKLFCVVSQNTDVDSLEVKSAFQPVRAVMSPQCGTQYTSKGNTAYLNALFALKERLLDPSIGSQTVDSKAAIAPQLTAARTAVHDLQSEFQIDNQPAIENAVGRLLNEPITGAETCTPGLDVGPVCAQFNATLKNKYPFSRTATSEASLADLNGFFNPRTGLLAQVQDQMLKNVIVEQGGRYMPNPLSPRPVRGDFLLFLNRSGRIRNALYPNGSQTIQMPLSIRVTPSPLIASVVLQIGDQVQTFAGGRTEAKAFVWNPNTQGTEMHVLLAGDLHLDDLKLPGPWGLFRLLDRMQLVSQGDSQVSFEWIFRERLSAGEVQDANGTPAMIRVDIVGDSAPIFRPDVRAGLQCVPTVTQ